MARRPGRAAASKAAAALRNTPQTYVEEPEDEEVMEEQPTSDAGTPQNVEDDEDREEEEEDVAGDEEDGTPARDSESQPTTPRTQVQAPKRRRLGRPPKIKPPGWDDDDGEDRPTPNRRRGRGGGFGRGGGRWGRKGGPNNVTQQPVDKDGNLMDVIDDEVVLPEDPEGEKKVTKLGELLGGREYRCRTFTLKGRPKIFMLSTEPARCMGFRDSYLFFTKHKTLYKVIVSEDEKMDMIEREIIPHSYKGRSIGLVAAHAVFKEFGARIVIGGRRVIDDYYVTKAKEEGAVEGDVADPSDVIIPGEPYNKNQYVAWHGASSVYHTNVPSVPNASGKVIDSKKRKVMVNDVNWMFEHALEASRFNSRIALDRQRNLHGVYEPNTNAMLIPSTMQPSHARWEPVPSATALQNTKSATDQPATIFTPVPVNHSRSFLIVDTIYENPTSSQLGVPGVDGNTHDIGFNGISSIPEELRNELPADCRKAFDEALTREDEWKSRWISESADARRRDPIIDKGLLLMA